MRITFSPSISFATGLHTAHCNGINSGAMSQQILCTLRENANMHRQCIASIQRLASGNEHRRATSTRDIAMHSYSMPNTCCLSNGRYFGRHSHLSRTAEVIYARWSLRWCHGVDKRQSCRIAYRKLTCRNVNER